MLTTIKNNIPHPSNHPHPNSLQNNNNSVVVNLLIFNSWNKGRKEKTKLSDGHSAKEFVELHVVVDDQLQVAGDENTILRMPPQNHDKFFRRSISANDTRWIVKQNPAELQFVINNTFKHTCYAFKKLVSIQWFPIERWT